MNYEITLKELLELSKISGTIAGIADGMQRPLIGFNDEKSKLYDLSDKIMEIINKIEQSKPLEDISKV